MTDFEKMKLCVYESELNTYSKNACIAALEACETEEEFYETASDILDVVEEDGGAVIDGEMREISSKPISGREADLRRAGVAHRISNKLGIVSTVGYGASSIAEKTFAKKYNAASQKLANLSDELQIETDPKKKITLKQQITETRSEIDALNKKWKIAQKAGQVSAGVALSSIAADIYSCTKFLKAIK